VDQNGQQVIVIQPANPQVVYVPQYNPETIYTQAPPAQTTQTIVVHEDDDSMDAAAAGMIGFGVGVAMGAAMNSNYYHGPYGWGGYGMYGGYYGAGYNDVLDHREDMAEDYYDHREDMQENRKDMAEDREGKTASERQSTRQQSSTERQAGGIKARVSAKLTANQERARQLQPSKHSASGNDTLGLRSSNQPPRRRSGRQHTKPGGRSQAGGAGVSSLPSGYESRGHGQSASQMSSQRSSSGAGAYGVMNVDPPLALPVPAGKAVTEGQSRRRRGRSRRRGTPPLAQEAFAQPMSDDEAGDNSMNHLTVRILQSAKLTTLLLMIVAVSLVAQNPAVSRRIRKGSVLQKKP
jgi:hypothetical protein